VGSLVIAKPPRRWHDRDEPRFSETLSDLVSRFQRTAGLAFAKGGNADRHSMRVSILQATGEEESCVVEVVKKSKHASALQIDQSESDNPLLLDQKNRMVAEEHPLRAKFERLSQQEFKHGLLDKAAEYTFKAAVGGAIQSARLHRITAIGSSQERLRSVPI